uniref:Uncharacterized protein n=1 Tax=Panagrolaimus superbus TaxID=310955 RepID=A0A914Z165_9BILA
MDSKIFALILQKEDGYRRLIKPKNGNWKEPKEKWDFFKVYAALKQQPEIEHNCNTLNENLNSTAKSAFNLNKNIKTEIPAVPVLILPQKNVEPLQRNTLSSLSNSDNCINNNKIKTETSTVLATIQQKIPESHHSSEPATDDGESLTEIEVFVTDDNGSTDCDDSVPQDNRFASRRISMDLPTDAQLFSVYKVSSLEELLYLLCRGDFKYHNVFIIAFYRFKRTMFTYPNNEIVRLIYCAIRSGTLLETLNLNTEGYSSR